jgi:hypothetical protein
MTVSEHALLRRINRKLARRDEKITKCRRSGEYHHIDTWRNTLLTWPVDLQTFRHELGVLADREMLAT